MNIGLILESLRLLDKAHFEWKLNDFKKMSTIALIPARGVRKESQKKYQTF